MSRLRIVLIALSIAASVTGAPVAEAQIPPRPQDPEPSLAYSCLAYSGAPCTFTGSEGRSPWYPLPDFNDPTSGQLHWGYFAISGYYGATLDADIVVNEPLRDDAYPSYCRQWGGRHHIGPGNTGRALLYFCVGYTYTVTINDTGFLYVGTQT